MLKIGITSDGFVQWGGGLDFLRTIVSSLHATSVPMELHLLVPGTGPRAVLKLVDQHLRTTAKTILRRKLATTHKPSRADLNRAIETFDAPIQMHDIDIGYSALARHARKLSLDVLLPSFYPLPFGSELPWLGYLYDFQHRHLPEFFTAREREQRNIDFEAMLTHARGIIVNAQAVASDIKTFYPSAQSSVFALPFSTAPSPEWLAMDVAPVRDKYKIPKRYFIICNQFWQHKDHSTAFKAFAKFATESGHTDIDIVCTGATSDYRSVEYFNSLLNQIREQHLQTRVHILGLIPKNDQISLLKGAIALLQPTLNEGGPGGGAVYDAVALGVPAIVSDIPVNREIVGEEIVSFFRARDSESLANAMQVCVKRDLAHRPTNVQLIEQGRLRRQRCGNVLLTSIDSVRR
jgi:glycosyltransferase involved in cell wall biosynthesis